MNCPPRAGVLKNETNVLLPDPLTSCSDEDLLVRFCRGQTEAFGILVRRYERELYGYLRRYLGDSDLAEEDRKSTRLNSSHSQISYAVFCLQKEVRRFCLL